ncbi:HD domain-containing protein [Marinicellulosiphila megalodicopiae]|uniref:HD domain-containing protein n=1 Tax=Marinicellulosiphila megalodicopiae TaxID=2724896 RepID=UPI003BAFEF6E
MNEIALLGLELDKLKSVYRKSYITDGSRNENSAEHSWHLAVALMGYSSLIPADVDINKCIQMALCHDICEIGAGDVCAYHDTSGKYEQEFEYMDEFRSRFPTFGNNAKELWEEYEAGVTTESQWVKVFDKLLPFLLNIASEGRTWMEQDITRSMVVKHNAFIGDVAPELLKWMYVEIDKAVNAGWLDPA